MDIRREKSRDMEERVSLTWRMNEDGDAYQSERALIGFICTFPSQNKQLTNTL